MVENAGCCVSVAKELQEVQVNAEGQVLTGPAVREPPKSNLTTLGRLGTGDWLLLGNNCLDVKSEVNNEQTQVALISALMVTVTFSVSGSVSS